MSDGLLIGLLVAAMAFTVFWLSVYAWLLYLLGKKIAASRFGRRKFSAAAFLICLGSLVLALPAILWLEPPILNVCAGFAIWITHAQPTLIGYWAGLELKRRKDSAEFSKRVDRWLREWEDPIPDWLKWELE